MTENKTKILIIDDEENTRTLLKEIVVSAGYEADDVPDGASALSKIKNSFYDILLVDYKLSDMNGLDVIKKAQDLSKNSIPIIITGSISIEIAVQGMMIGARDYMVKPVNPEEIKKLIATVLTEREASAKGMLAFTEAIQSLIYAEEAEVDVIIDRTDVPSITQSFDSKRNIITKIKDFLWPDLPE